KFCRRLGQLRLERAIHESHWSESYKFGAPEPQQNFSSTADNKGQRENDRADLYDSTAADSVQVLTSMIMSGVTPANSIWFKAQP
ncbi:portal protein, partial [Acinetobacter baumannii]